MFPSPSEVPNVLVQREQEFLCTKLLCTQELLLSQLQSALDQCDPEGKIERFCDTTSGEAPYHFPTKEAKVEWEGEPLSSALDSPNFRLDFEEKDKPKE